MVDIREQAKLERVRTYVDTDTEAEDQCLKDKDCEEMRAPDNAEWRKYRYSPWLAILGQTPTGHTKECLNTVTNAR